MTRCRVRDSGNTFLEQQALDILSNPDNVQPATISEDVFVTNYLKGLVDGTGVTRWANEVAGSMYKPVKIMRGDVHITTVPPLAAQREMGVRTTRAGSVAEIVAVTNLKHGHIPGSGERYFEGATNALVKDPSTLTTARADWVALYRMYNVTLLPDTTTSATEPTEEVASNPFGDDYDEM